MKSHAEIEWQFASTSLADARAWLAAQPREASQRRLAALPSLQLHDTYYDSADWMIHRAGFALRLRREGDAAAGSARNEVTLKSLRAPVAGISRRLEISAQVASADMSAVLASGDAIAARIRELIGVRALAVLFHAHTRREAWQLLEAESELALAEVALDETSLETPAGVKQHLTRVEVECINAEPAALLPWVSQFRDQARLQPLNSSKYRAGLDAAGLEPGKPLDLGSVAITAAQDFALSQLAQLRRYFVQVLDVEPRVRADLIDAVHEMRVAARHLDVLLRSWRRRGPDWAIRERRTLKLLIRALGAVRDREVQVAHLERSRVTLDDSEQAALLPVLERLREQRRKMRERLLHTLDSERVRFWIEGWREKLAGNAAIETVAVRTGAVARDLVREQARKLRKRADLIHADSGPEEFHEVRIRAKRLRYTIDAFEPLYGETGRNFTRALGKLQDVLGEFHDAAVREKHFAALANDAPAFPSSTSFIMGRLAERDRRAYERCQRKFSKAYSRIRGKRWRALADLMLSQSQAEKT